MAQANIPLESLLTTTNGSIYKVTILAAKRAICLSDGEKSLLEKPGEKALDNALREIGEGKIKIKNKK